MILKDLLALDKACTNPIQKLVSNFGLVNNAIFQLSRNVPNEGNVKRLEDKLKIAQETIKILVIWREYQPNLMITHQAA